MDSTPAEVTRGSLFQLLRIKSHAVVFHARNFGGQRRHEASGFLAAGLVWGLIQSVPAFAFQIKVFFLLCVIIAGVYGAVTVSRRILYVQAAPAALALILLWLA